MVERSALSDLLDIPSEKLNDDRLYRALDQVLPRKDALEKHLKERLGRIFELEYDLLLYLRFVLPKWADKPRDGRQDPEKALNGNLPAEALRWVHILSSGTV